MATEVQTAPLLEQKFFRYRSVKKATARKALSSPPLPPAASTLQDECAARSASRYRRSRPGKTPPSPPSIVFPVSVQDQEESQPPSPTSHASELMRPACQESPSRSLTFLVPEQQAPETSPAIRVDQLKPTTRSRTISEPRQNGPYEAASPRGTLSEPTTKRPQTSGERHSRQQTHENKARREARRMLEAEAERPRRTNKERQAEKQMETIRRKGAEEGHREGSEEQGAARTPRVEVGQLKRLQKMELKGSEKGPDVAQPPLSSKPSFTGDRFGILSRTKWDKSTLAASSGIMESKGLRKGMISPPTGIEPGGGGIVPGKDAPISAVNAGERRVSIKCDDSSITLPITAMTTTVDLIFSAANVLSQSIQPRASVLLESFTQVGLERPIRKYEHVRDIMNSWDHDAQNNLLLVPSASVGNENDLDVKSVPKEQPGNTSVYVYYSQKPGKWDKRWITLRSDGQVQVAKRNGAEMSNICHMSDFDIYIPTQRQLSKRIKPPKKWCFAVKSQQKSAIFLSTANFVHFFATNDKKLAAAWYSAVQGWRSWYLVNVMGKGHSKSDKTDANATAASYQGPASGARLQRPRHQNKPSTDSTPYQIGAFKPLPVMDQFQSNLSPKDRLATSIPAEPPSHTEAWHARKMSVRGRGAPPVSLPKKLTKDATTGESTTHTRGPSLVQGAPPQEVESTTFAPTGLLGRTYSQRQKAQREREIASPSSNAGPFLPGLLSGEPNSPVQASIDQSERPVLGRTMSIRSVNKDSAGLKRTTSQRQKPKPLVDLAPKFKEPPQHTRKGRGLIPQQLPPGGLVDIATSPEVPIPIPPATTWRRPGTGNGEGVVLQRTRTTRPSIDAGRSSGKDGEDAFTGGLLARTGTSQGGMGKGRGVVTGDRNAREPMLDVSEESRFAPGSLLAHVEQHTCSSGPVLEREKRTEVNAAVGEGM